MAKRYNPPPGWRVPAEGWRPSFAWKPDPAWPPAPPGWVFWVEQERVVAPAAAPSRINRRYVGVAVGAVALAGLIALGAVNSRLGDGSGHPGTSVALAAVSSPEPSAAAVLPTSTLAPAPAPAAVAPAKAKAKPHKAAAAPKVVPQTRSATATSSPAKQTVAKPTVKKTVKKVTTPSPQQSAPSAPSPSSPRQHHHDHSGGGFPGFFWFLSQSRH